MDENKTTIQKVAMIIPMRIASTRLPGKQHQLIGHKPLIYHVLDSALKTKIRPIYIACDDIKHFDLINQYDGGGGLDKIEPIMTSKSHNSGSDRIYEASQILEKRGENFDIIINLQGDMPFFEAEIVDKALDLMNSNTTFDITTCAIRSSDINAINLPSNPKVVMGIDNSALYFSRSVIPHNANEALLHVGIYAYKIDALKRFMHTKQSQLEISEKLEQLRALENGMKIGVCIVNSAPVSVDTPDDLEYAREYYKKLDTEK
ncbi:MAG: 3-deoxy-manno-octulosonate cytidylyltransferase [Rickettsiaceae bacterium]|nr:3-deoxy-manno-octulosonate cytidylyltransferase [Rickettsiaceae bacterium]